MKNAKQMRIVAEKTEIANLKPGDLYSDRGPEHWNRLGMIPGAQAYVRTDGEVDDPSEMVYKLTIVRIGDNVEDSNAHIRQPTVSPYVPPGMTHDEWNKK